MKKGKLYKLQAPSWMYDKDYLPRLAICCVPEHSVLIYLETSLREPYWHRVIYGDQTWYVVAYNLSEISNAEPKTETRT